MIPWWLFLFTFVCVPVLIKADESDSEIDEKPNQNAVRNSTTDSIQQLDISLSFDRMELKTLPDGFVKSQFLTHLSLEDNQIETISYLAFQFVPQVSHLSLANNFLRNIDLEPFSGLVNLQTLNLNGNCKEKGNSTVAVPVNSSRTTTESDFYLGEYTTTEPVWGFNWKAGFEQRRETLCEVNFGVQLPNLSKLSLENNNLKRLRVSHGTNLPGLRHLYLSHNLLETNNELMSNLGQLAPLLSDLHLKGSSIFEFDASRLPTITSLYLDQNRISCICNEYCDGPSLKLKGSRNLKTLSVSGNEIWKIEADAFNYSTSLVTLDLSKNKISKIREGTFGKLNLLRFLHLEFNNLAELNGVDSFRGLISLENLFLGNNDLSNIKPGAFEDLVTLKTLELNSNKIFDLDSGIFSNLTSLEELSLARNQLSKIFDGTMPSSGSLITLNLDNNRFRNTEDIFIPHSPNLKTLSLKDNPLEAVTIPWGSVASKNITIVLGNTYCDD